WRRPWRLDHPAAVVTLCGLPLFLHRSAHLDRRFRLLARCNTASNTGNVMASIYDFTARDIDGKERSLSEFRGKLLLIVNTASQCGFTYQYKGLEELHRKYAAQGVEVLGFPCNQFGKQEPGDAEEIKNFCSLTYDVTFP